MKSIIISLIILPFILYNQPAKSISDPKIDLAETNKRSDSDGSLKLLLNPDETLKQNTGFSGSFDATGWSRVTKPDGTSRFIPINEATLNYTSNYLLSSVPDDENWDDRFGTEGINGTVNAIAVSNGDVYVGGSFTMAGSVNVSNIARWDGSSWFALGSGVNGHVKAIAISGNDVFVGGWFTIAGGIVVNRIAKWDGNSWSVLGSGIENGWVDAIAVNGSDIYVGGQFSKIDGEELFFNIAKWDGSSWSALGGGVAGYPFIPYGVSAISVIDNVVYVGGSFQAVFTDGVYAPYIAKFDGSSWSSLDAGVYPPVDDPVDALAKCGSDLYIGGRFQKAGSGSLYARGITKWDGSSWSTLGYGMTSEFTTGVYAIAIGDKDVYAGGLFHYAGSNAQWEANCIAKWDGSSWSALGSGLSYPSYVLAIAISGRDVYVGGTFSTAGGKPSLNFAHWIIPDKDPPLLIDVPSDITVECNGIPDPVNVTAEDKVDGSVPVTFTETETSGSECPELKVIKRTWTATDVSNNTASATQIITVIDNNAPVPQAEPAGITIQCINDIPLPVNLSADDNCAGLITVNPTEQITPGSCPGRFVLVRTWTFVDNCGNSTSRSQTITVSDVTPPIISGLPLKPLIIENDPDQCGASVDFSFITATDNCSGDVILSFEPASGTLFPVGTSTVNITTTDGCGNSATASFNVNVTNEIPVINAINFPIDPIAVETAVIANASFTDNNLSGASWEWGDGVISAGTINGQTITGDHQYLMPGVYTIKLSVFDQCGGLATKEYQYLVVYDPQGGFITGGGWINSPDGALVGTHITGKANFGFVSKYKKGSNIPDGNTEFQFHEGNLNFKSSSYNLGSLVIAGYKAIYKGVGTINGTGSYKFMVSAVDGDVTGGGSIDKFRIKIWDKTTGAIIYDNNIGKDENELPTTVLGGGSIVIHKPDTKTTKSIQMAEFSLKVYPNPFTDHIYFDLQQRTDSKVRLEIFDISGTKLATVYNDVVVAFDRYQFEYTPKNVSSGILFYHLTVDGQLMFTGKLIHY